jgi:hypothetical protein
MIRAKAYVGMFEKTNGRERVVFVHPNAEYVWDKLFEHFDERHGGDILDSMKTRRACKDHLKKLGYRIRRGQVTTQS